MEGRLFNFNFNWLLHATPEATWGIIVEPEMSWPI